MQDYIERFRAARVVPVIVLDDPTRAVPLAKALLAQGITAAEVTFRTPAAEESIRRIAAEVPDIFVGAGTVLTEDELARAHAAGAQFAVAPGLDPAILDAAAELGLPFCPGVATASEFMAAIRLGCRMVKFFPARDAGGIPLLKSILAAIGHTGVQVMPTGGISQASAEEWLAIPQVVCVGGSWMVKPILASL